MADHRPDGRDSAGSDRIDAWMREPVRPMLPQPGAFERIRRRARRRKLRQTAVSAAGVAALVAVGITVPRLVVPHLRPGRPAANGSPTVEYSQPAQRPSPTQASGIARPHTTVPAPATSVAAPQPVPAGFQVSSVTFVGPTIGWVIGLAGVAGQCGTPKGNLCLSVAGTNNAGNSWYAVNPPAPMDPRGVSQIRFQDTQNGWAFGPELWATHDAGVHWRRVATHGMRVIALEARNERVFAVWARCGGLLLGPLSDCTDFSLYSAPAGGDRWKQMPGTTGVALGGSPALVLTGTDVYLFSPDGSLLTIPNTGTGPLRPASGGGSLAHAPCGPTQKRGQPPRALLASTGNGLVLLCAGTASGSNQPKTLYYSPNGGATWHHAGSVPQAGLATSLAGTPRGSVVLATTRGIDVSTRHTGSWPAASWRPAGAPVAGGFSYVGMTTDSQGVAVPSDTGMHAVWFTHDRGLDWAKSPVR